MSKRWPGWPGRSWSNRAPNFSYLLRHDPAFRNVRREHLIEAGKGVRLRDNVRLFTEILRGGLDGNHLDKVRTDWLSFHKAAAAGEAPAAPNPERR